MTFASRFYTEWNAIEIPEVINVNYEEIIFASIKIGYKKMNYHKCCHL